LRGDNAYEHAGSNPKKVIEWYNTFGKEDDMSDFVVKHLQGSMFEITFTIPEDYLPMNRGSIVTMLETTVDPDDDGNNPLKIGKTKYFVSGKLETVNGKELKYNERGYAIGY